MAQSAPPILVYAIMGSQFVAKVLVALDSAKIPHHIFLCSMDKAKREQELPAGAGGRQVPVIKCGDTVVADSEAILHWLDENRSTDFFPSPTASQISKRASDQTLAASVWYYNWVDDDGYRRSMRATASRFFPFFIPFKGNIVDCFVGSARNSFRRRVKETMNLQDEELNDEPQMRQRLCEELEHFQSFLKSDSQDYLLEGTTSPTAADCSVYAQLERLVGDTGDADIGAALPTLKDDPSLQRLMKWHSLMRERHPIVFKGKRAKL